MLAPLRFRTAAIFVAKSSNLSTGTVKQEFLADAPTDGSTVLMPVLASDLGLTPANPRLTYAVNAFDTTGAGESVPGTASFNVFMPISM